MGAWDPDRREPAHGYDGRTLCPAPGGQSLVLAGSVSTDPVVRVCEVPAEKSLFFPLINTIYIAFLSDPPETRTEEFVRQAGSCAAPVQISVRIDSFTVPGPLRFFTGASGSQSPFFNVQLPPGNVFGVDETKVPDLVLSPSAEQGYYLFVLPLSPGTHTIRWTASGCQSPEFSRTSRTISRWSASRNLKQASPEGATRWVL